MSAEAHHLARAFGLLWGRLGRARLCLAAIAIAIVALAGVGLWHLLVPTKRTAASPPATTAVAPSSPPSAERSSATPAPSSSRNAAALDQRVLISDLKQKEQRGPRGETFVIATIGLAAQTNVEKSGVEIHVYFYDLTAANEMRPTDAQVTYQWLTPVRDWSDPTPKYLAATYFKPPTPSRSFERVRYGGFVVRVLCDGKLQDERSQPEALVAQLRRNASEPPVAASVAATSSPSFHPSEASPSPASSPPSDFRPPTSDLALPYGKPIPGKPGFLYSPYDPKFIIDVRGFPPGTLVNDPNTNKPFRVP